MKRAYLSQIKPDEIFHMKDESFFQSNIAIQEHVKKFGLDADSSDILAMTVEPETVRGKRLIKICGFMHASVDNRPVLVEVSFTASAHARIYKTGTISDLEKLAGESEEDPVFYILKDGEMARRGALEDPDIDEFVEDLAEVLDAIDRALDELEEMEADEDEKDEDHRLDDSK